MFGAELPKVSDWMQAWEGRIGVLVSVLAVITRGLMPPRTCKPHRQLTNVGYIDVNETAPNQSQHLRPSSIP